jgi:uncharacterized protein (TIGR02145 family)
MRSNTNRPWYVKLLLLTGIFSVLLLAGTCRRFEPDQLVIIETGTVSEITCHSCSVTGQIYDAGADGIDQHGFVWSLQQDPQIEGSSRIELGSRNHTGSFNGIISGLAHSTSYYIKAYGTAGSETTYGKEVTFTTSSPTVPVVITLQVSSITDSSALSGGEVTEDGGAEITARGVCWDTLPNPTLEDSLTNDGTGTGVFSSQVRNLSYGTAYYLRAYATNSVGTAYGEERQFTTGPRQPVLPAVTTGDITSITDSSATGGGTVIDDGGSEITARGICWSISQDPTILDDTTLNGAGTGEFISHLTGLDCNTIYYVRAYATNEAGTSYGEQKDFSTEACPVFLPFVVTLSAYEISDTAALSGGNVIDDGGAPVTARGVCWATHPDPSIDDDHTEDGTGTGSFTSAITDLEFLTTYYYTAYATNPEGTAYGDILELTTLDKRNHVTDIDRNTYRVVTIGSQVWMAENLRASRYADGTPIPLVEDQTTWGDLTISDKAFCYYSYDSTYKEDYGALYSWPAAMNGEAGSDLNPSGIQGACPDGWHLPGDNEWKDLEMFLGMTQNKADSTGYRGEGIGGKLKATGTDHWEDPNTGATDESGFSALPGGLNNSAGYCYNRTIDCYFWSSTDGGDNEIWYRYLSYERSEIYRDMTYWYGDGFSVRCVKDD